MFMHLTNYAINKKSANYVPNQLNNTATDTPNVCHKRSLYDIYKVLRNMGYNTDKLK